MPKERKMLCVFSACNHNQHLDSLALSLLPPSFPPPPLHVMLLLLIVQLLLPGIFALLVMQESLHLICFVVVAGQGGCCCQWQAPGWAGVLAPWCGLSHNCSIHGEIWIWKTDPLKIGTVLGGGGSFLCRLAFAAATAAGYPMRRRK